MALLFELEDHLATITLNRPEVLNVMDADTYRQLSEAWIRVRDDDEIWVAIITGAGERAFTAGADVKYLSDPTVAHRSAYWRGGGDPLLNRGLEVWKPIIAAVNGYCVGAGMTLLFATDIRIASDNATFGLPEVKRSFLPGNGGTQRAIRQLPYPIAMELLLTGDAISAARAFEIGLVNRVVPLADLLTTAREFAERIVANGPLAVRATKELAVRAQYLPLADGLRFEQAVADLLFSSEDAKEGPLAFVEKRPPHFSGT